MGRGRLVEQVFARVVKHHWKNPDSPNHDALQLFGIMDAPWRSGGQPIVWQGDNSQQEKGMNRLLNVQTVLWGHIRSWSQGQTASFFDAGWYRTKWTVTRASWIETISRSHMYWYRRHYSSSMSGQPFEIKNCASLSFSHDIRSTAWHRRHQ